MEKLTFKITIDASREKVWDVLWNDATYPVWTEPFSSGSKAVTDWQEGSKILFLDAEDRGMVSKVKENRPNEYMGIEHQGYYMKGVEDFDSEEVKKWAGSTENYTLTTVDRKTELLVESDITPEFKDMFEGIWPKALDKVKELAEN